MISRRSAPTLTSYQRARLQVVGYRTIQTSVNEILSRHDINTSQWIILGWLHDNSEGMRVTALANILDVETPLVTTLIGPLQSKGLIQAVTDHSDKRAKVLTLTEAGEVLVGSLEDEMNERLSFYELGFKRQELEAYFSALGRFIENAKQKD